MIVVFASAWEGIICLVGCPFLSKTNTFLLQKTIIFLIKIQLILTNLMSPGLIAQVCFRVLFLNKVNIWQDHLCTPWPHRTTFSVREPEMYFNPPSYTVLAWLEHAVEARCSKSSTVVEMSMVGLHSTDCIFSPSWLNHMLWKQKLISVIFSVHQLLQCCNLILCAETPLSTAARTSAIPKQLWRKKKSLSVG